MGWIIAAGVLVLALALLALLPVRVHLLLNQLNLHATLRIDVRVAPFRLTRVVSLSEKAAEGLEKGWNRWRQKGAPVSEDQRETFRKLPRQQLAEVALPGLRYLGRSTRCSRFRLRLEVGGFDAFDSALLAGTGWGGAYILVAQLGRWLQLDRSGVRIAVVPNFQRTLLRTDLDCILTLRLGKAITAVAMLLRQLLARREVVAWARDSWRRKGDASGGGTPDSGPHEDGHGEH